jgi:hypothetical protein
MAGRKKTDKETGTGTGSDDEAEVETKVSKLYICDFCSIDI